MTPPIPRTMRLQAAREDLARAETPEERAKYRRRVRALEASTEEYVSDFAPAGEGWITEDE